MQEDVIYISPEDMEIIGQADWSCDIESQFSNISEVSKTFLEKAKNIFVNIEKILYSTPAFINAIKSSIPQEAYKAILTDEQKQKVAKGALKLMTKKDGSLMANLVDTKTNKIVGTISLKKVSVSPELTQAMGDYVTQMQMAQIAEQIQSVQIAVEEVRMGQEFDRLATAYSCQQKLLQAMRMQNLDLKKQQLLRIVCDAEDSRNLLMLSQNANVKYIKEQPEDFFGKIFNGATKSQIEGRMHEIRESLCAVNMVSLVETVAYQELGEVNAAKKALEYYGKFLQETYLNTEGFVERLDLIDASPTQYWTQLLPKIEDNIQRLSTASNVLLVEGN